QIFKWLEKINLKEYYRLFKENDITIDLITSLDYQLLKELGIKKVGDIIRFQISIDNLKSEYLLNSSSFNDFIQNYLYPNSTTTTTTTTTTTITNNNTLDNNDKKLNIFPSNLNPITPISLATPTSLTNLIQKNIVTFIISDGSTKKINIEGCSNSDSIKSKALKKFNLSGIPNDYNIYYLNDKRIIDRIINDYDLIQICFSLTSFEKDRLILTLRDHYPNETSINISHRLYKKPLNNLKNISENLISNSNSNSNSTRPKSILKNKNFNTDKFIDTNNTIANTITNTNLNANISINKNPNTNDSIKLNRPLKTVYGQRPPSELISTNLAEYFPNANSNDLMETIKNSAELSKAISRLTTFSDSNFPNLNISDDIRSSILTFNSNYNYRNSHNFHNSLNTNTNTNNNKHISNNSLIGLRSSRIIGDSYKNNNLDINNFKSQPKVRQISRSRSKSRSRSRQTNMKSPVVTQLSVSTPFQNSPLLRVSTDFENLNYSSDEEDFDEFYKHNANLENEKWIKGAIIGNGSIGVVYLGLNSFTGELMAVKEIEINNETEIDNESRITNEKVIAKNLENEINLLKHLNHENIVCYLGSTYNYDFNYISNEVGNYLNIFSEYIPGGSISSLLMNYGKLEEPLIRNFIKQILTGISYLHSNNIIHKDIKGSNVLIDNKGCIKISDFGFSKKICYSQYKYRKSDIADISEVLGPSVYWMAPEVITEYSFSEKTDIWSIGCLMVEMFTAQHPFPNFTIEEAIFQIGENKQCPTLPENAITNDASDFLNQVFSVDSRRPPTVSELLHHPFISTVLL
ncbi:kinase-like protein, partial [Ascoidea rubescens DSM 1968]